MDEGLVSVDELQAWFSNRVVQVWDQEKALGTYYVEPSETPDSVLERWGFSRISAWFVHEWANGLPNQEYCIVLRKEENL